MDVEIKDQERLFELIREGTGFVLLTAHVGCWQVALSALHFLKVQVTMVLQQEEGNVDRQYFEHAGLPCPYQTIDPGGYLGGSLEMMRVLREGGILCMMGDRVFGSGRNTLCCDFLGGRASFPYSPFKLASATGVPVVVLLSNKTGPRTYALNVTKVIEVPRLEGRSGEVFRPYLSQFVDALESYSREFPYQFFNFHDMWEDCS
jgi:predicted LPLAT superfamily acyltransferase